MLTISRRNDISNIVSSCVDPSEVFKQIIVAMRGPFSDPHSIIFAANLLLEKFGHNDERIIRYFSIIRETIGVHIDETDDILNVLVAISDGYEVNAFEYGKYIVVENPNADKDPSFDPFLVLDVSILKPNVLYDE